MGTAHRPRTSGDADACQRSRRTASPTRRFHARPVVEDEPGGVPQSPPRGRRLKGSGYHAADFTFKARRSRLGTFWFSFAAVVFPCDTSLSAPGPADAHLVLIAEIIGAVAYVPAATRLLVIATARVIRACMTAGALQCALAFWIGGAAWLSDFAAIAAESWSRCGVVTTKPGVTPIPVKRTAPWGRATELIATAASLAFSGLKATDETTIAAIVTAHLPNSPASWLAHAAAVASASTPIAARTTIDLAHPAARIAQPAFAASLAALVVGYASIATAASAL